METLLNLFIGKSVTVVPANVTTTRFGILENAREGYYHAGQFFKAVDVHSIHYTRISITIQLK